jgi:hypothetical protein
VAYGWARTSISGVNYYFPIFQRGD